jgi:hypothetical protein
MKASDRTGTLPASLRADCARCAGLCCVVPTFYSLQGFGFDKPAHSACRHLTPGNRCSIHDERTARGFASCVVFDCHGAGQRVTQQLFAGADWRVSKDLATRMFRAYESCVALHRLMALLALAESVVDQGLRRGADLELGPAVSAPPPKDQLRAKREQLDEFCRSTGTRTTRLDIATLQRETYALIRLICPPQAASAPARTLRPAGRPE